MPRSEEEQKNLDLAPAMYRDVLIAMNPDAVGRSSRLPMFRTPPSSRTASTSLSTTAQWSSSSRIAPAAH